MASPPQLADRHYPAENTKPDGRAPSGAATQLAFGAGGLAPSNILDSRSEYCCSRMKNIRRAQWADAEEPLMSSGARVHEFFYEVNLSTIRAIDELVKNKFPWQGLRRYEPSTDELTIAFWAVYDAGPLPQRKSYILSRLAYYIGQKPQHLVEAAGRDWPVLDELTALSPRPTRAIQGEDTSMAKTATAPAAAAKPAAAAPVTKADEKTVQAVAAADAAAEVKPRSGKAPDGSTWVDWFKKGHAAGTSAVDLRDEYIRLRTPEYSDRMEVLKRHAYRHLRLALPNVTLPKPVKETPAPAATPAAAPTA